jgi:hypothetical protein
MDDSDGDNEGDDNGLDGNNINDGDDDESDDDEVSWSYRLTHSFTTLRSGPCKHTASTT